MTLTTMVLPNTPLGPTWVSAVANLQASKKTLSVRNLASHAMQTKRFATALEHQRDLHGMPRAIANHKGHGSAPTMICETYVEATSTRMLYPTMDGMVTMAPDGVAIGMMSS